MITIIKKELLDHLTSSQFVILLAMVLVLFLASGILYARRYDRRVALYASKTTEVLAHPSTVSTDLYLHPERLIFVAEGGDRYRPAGYTLRPRAALSPLVSDPVNFKLPEVAEPDWSFIIRILLSLYVILLSYDAISGERERGTLRALLSHPVGRMRLLLAKYIATLTTLSVQMVFGMLCCLLIMAIIQPSVIAGSNIVPLLLILLLALLYLSIFVTLSLLVSSLLHQSSVALLTLLALWILFAIVIPNVAGVVSEQITTVPSEYFIAREVEPTIQKQIWAGINTIRERASHGELRTVEEVRHEADRAFEQGQQNLIGHYEGYARSMRERAAVSRAVARISPSALFQYAAEAVAGTGFHHEERFLRDVASYASEYDRYVARKVGVLVSASNWSFATNIDVGGRSILLTSPSPQEYRGDMSDFPRFAESMPSAVEAAGEALSDCAGLILWNIALAVCAFWAISKCDVR